MALIRALAGSHPKLEHQAPYLLALVIGILCMSPPPSFLKAVKTINTITEKASPFSWAQSCLPWEFSSPSTLTDRGASRAN
jgi:hypothetical protein|tara:strand:+ start:331 stop:573 length:243 start_codon:yes stop_codon:yes gene_type:complete